MAQNLEQMKTAIALMKLLAQGEEDIRSGQTILQDEVFRNLLKKFAKTGRPRFVCDRWASQC